MRVNVVGARTRTAVFVSVVCLAQCAFSDQTEAGNKYKAEIVPNFPHLGSIESIAISPDGTLILSGSWDGGLKLWEAKTGRLIREFSGHAENKLAVPPDQPVTLSSKVASVAFSPDGLRAVSGSDDETVKLWDITTGRVLKTFSGHKSFVNCVDFSPDGRAILSGSSDSTVALWDAETGKLLRTFNGHKKKVTSVKFSPTGTTLLSGSYDASFKLWDVASGRLIRNFDTRNKPVTDVAFAPDGSLILSANEDDNVLQLWSTKTGNVVRSFTAHSKWIDLISFSKDGQNVLSVSSDGMMEVWNKDSGQPIRQAKLPFTSASSVVAISRDDHTVFSGGGDRVLKVWDVASGQLVNTFAEKSKKITSVAVSRDGNRIVSGSWDLTIKIWESDSGRLVRNLTGHSSSVTSVAVSSDASRVLSGSWDKTVKLWDSATGENLRTFEGHTQFVTSVAFSYDAKVVLSGSWDKTLRLWDALSGRLLRVLQGQSGPIETVAFSPDGQRAVSGDRDGNVVLWDISTGQQVLSIPGHSGGVLSVAFSASGDQVLSGGADSIVKLWRADSGALIKSFEGHFYTVTSVAFSIDGSRILSGSWDGSLKLWDVATGRVVQTIQGNLAAVNAVASWSDAIGISGGADGTTRVWNVNTGDQILALVGATSDEWLAITPEGFFSAASTKASPLLSIVRGLDAYGVDQFWQSLYSPDLVREKLAGDTDKEVERAATLTNLEKVLDTGQAPRVVINAPKPGTTVEKELVEANASIEEQDNGGIGRIEWRVNGITVGVSSSPRGSVPAINAVQTLALESGANTIEVVAYNGRNLLASVASETTVNWAGTSAAAKPKLHVLAIGIDAYQDSGLNDVTTGKHFRFPPLQLAAADTRAFGEAIKAAASAKDQYASVEVTLALDAEATMAGLDEKIGRIAAKAAPHDTFILYAAGHGFSTGGRFYLIPQDYKGEGTSIAQALGTRAIGQDKLQDWLTNRIKTKKALVLLDTCASGALVADYSASRVDLPASESAIGRLHEATGRPVLTAAAAGKLAVEGVGEPGKKHGVFTYAVLEAFVKGDSNGNGLIELSELASYVQKRVPEISPTINLGKSQQRVTQKPKLGSRGEDFAIVGRLH